MFINTDKMFMNNGYVMEVLISAVGTGSSAVTKIYGRRSNIRISVQVGKVSF